MDKATLHSLLEKFNDVQRQDIKDLTGGHLNESKLCQGAEKGRTGNIWRSAKKETSRKKKSKYLKNKSIYNRQLPDRENKKEVGLIQIRTAPGTSSLAEKLGNVKIEDESSLKDYPTKFLTKESFLPEIMVPTYSERASFSKEFIPSYLMFPTKEEQLKQFKTTKKQLLSSRGRGISYNCQLKKDLLKIVENMKHKLKVIESQEVIAFSSYFKLMVYNESWEEVIKLLRKDGEELKSIKREYDVYVNALLDEQMHLNELFPLEDYAGLSIPDTVDDPKFIKEGERKLRTLEDQLLNVLKDNERLRKLMKDSLNDDTQASSIFKPSDVNGDVGQNKGFHGDIKSEDALDDLEIEVMTLHAQIEEQYQELKRMRQAENKNYIPHVVCQRLEQCIKEADVDIQRIGKQNDFLEYDVQALEEKLEGVLVRTGLKERDARLLWRKVSVSEILTL